MYNTWGCRLLALESMKRVDTEGTGGKLKPGETARNAVTPVGALHTLTVGV